MVIINFSPTFLVDIMFSTWMKTNSDKLCPAPRKCSPTGMLVPVHLPISNNRAERHFAGENKDATKWLYKEGHRKKRLIRS